MEHVSKNFGRRCHCQHLYLSIGASIHSLVHMEHTSRPCEPNCGYLPLCLDTNGGNDTFFQNSWIPVPFNVHYQQNTVELQHFFYQCLDTLFRTVNFQFKTLLTVIKITVDGKMLCLDRQITLY